MKLGLALIIAIVNFGALPVQAAGPGLVVNYPPEIISPQDKFNADLGLIQEMIANFNSIGELARTNWPANAGKFNTYRTLFKQYLMPLIKEKNANQLAVRQQSYGNNQWRSLTRQTRIQSSSKKVVMGGKVVGSTSQASYSGLDALKQINFASLKGCVNDPIENFTAYTKVDDGGFLSIIPSKITATVEDSNGGNYVYKDFGANHFGDFSHNFSLDLVAMDAGAELNVWSLGDTTGVFLDWVVACSGMAVYLFRDAAPPFDYHFVLEEYVSFNGDYTLSVSPGLHYCTVERAGTTLTDFVYSDEVRTTLEGIETCDCSNNKLRYLQVCFATWPPPLSGITETYSLSDLDIGEGPAPPAPVSSYPQNPFGWAVLVAILVLWLIASEDKRRTEKGR